MPKILAAELPDGSIWDIPIEVIANDRAAQKAKNKTGVESGVQFDIEFNKDIAITTNNDSLIVEWADTKMNWKDVKQSAKRRRDVEENNKEMWLKSKKTVVIVP